MTLDRRKKTTIIAEEHQDLALSQFLEHFQKRISVLGQEYNQPLHGNVDIVASFGRIYLVDPPVSFVEDTDGVSLRQINWALASSRRYNLSPQLQVVKRRHMPWIHGSGVRSGPFTKSSFVAGKRGATVQDVEEILSDMGFGEPEFNEVYRAIIAMSSHEVKAVYNKNLEFQSWVSQKTRWMTTDVKRAWVEDESKVDGKESDLRIQVRTRKMSDAEKCDSSIYEGLLFWEEGTRKFEDSHPSVRESPDCQVRSQTQDPLENCRNPVFNL